MMARFWCPSCQTSRHVTERLDGVTYDQCWFCGTPAPDYKERPMRVRDLPLPIYLFVLTIVVVLTVLTAWAVLSLWFPSEPLPKQVLVQWALPSSRDL